MLHRGRVSKRELERVIAEQTAAARPVPFMVAFDFENYWRTRGEAAIRQEMERALERRLVRGRRLIAAVA